MTQSGNARLGSAYGGPWGLLFRRRTIDDADLKHDGNIFNIVRLVLASMVMFSHAFDITGRALGDDPSTIVLPFPISRLAVLLFFSLSGFLVTGGLIKHGIAHFIVSRALRLIPGLWVMLICTGLLVGLMFCDVSFLNMLSSPSFVDYIVYNGLLLGREYTIAGAFSASPLSTLVNGSLWTIPNEVRCYMLLVLVGSLLAFKRLIIGVFISYLIINLIVPANILPFVAALRPLVLSFFFGVLIYVWRSRVFLSLPFGIGLSIVATCIPNGLLAQTAVGLSGAYLMFVISFTTPNIFKGVSKKMPDYSYGIYIYAFPVQQAVLFLGFGTTPYMNFLIGILAVLPFASLSWHFVEKPSLALKPRLSRALDYVLNKGSRSNAI